MTELYTSKEAAEILKVSQQAVRNMIDRHEIKAVKIGRAYRIPVSEIERITTPEDFTEPVKEASAATVFAQKSSISLEQALKENRKE